MEIQQQETYEKKTAGSFEKQNGSTEEDSNMIVRTAVTTAKEVTE
jgi:hypothetical protein